MGQRSGKDSAKERECERDERDESQKLARQNIFKIVRQVLTINKRDYEQMPYPDMYTYLSIRLSCLR